MASDIARITGEVKSVDTKRGTSKAGRPYVIVTANVLVADRGFAAVQLDDDMSTPERGDQVDYLVELQASEWGLRMRTLSEFPALDLTY